MRHASKSVVSDARLGAQDAFTTADGMGAPGSAGPRVCLVTMPFGPASLPALGASLLKAVVEREGMAADVYYGNLHYLRRKQAAEGPAATDDYEFVASALGLGDVVFAPALWGGRLDAVDAHLRLVVDSGHATVGDLSVPELASRLRRWAEQASADIEAAFLDRDWSAYDVVGFSSTFSQSTASIALARRIKETHPTLVTVFGGANVQGDMGRELLRSFHWIDAIIEGEAEYALPAFLRRLRDRDAWADIPGCAYLGSDGRTVDGPPAALESALDRLPLPDFADYFAQLSGPAGTAPAVGAESIRLPFESSRGCWWGARSHCTFCGLNPAGMDFREKSVERVLHEVRSLSARWQVRSFIAVDNIMSRDHLANLVPALATLDADIFYEVKSNLTEAHVRSLAEAGIRSLQPGIESLDSTLLKLMRKGSSATGNLELLKWCRVHDVDPTWFLLYGFPNESDASFDSTRTLCDQIHHLPPPRHANPVIVDRFSPLYTRRESFGLRSIRPVASSFAAYSGLDADAIARLSYHFTATLPQAAPMRYLPSLTDAVARWHAAFAAGAYFVYLAGPSSALVLDGRGPERRAVALLGRNLWLLDQARTAVSPSRVLHRWQQRRAETEADVEPALSGIEVELTLAMLRLGVRCPDEWSGDAATLETALDTLVGEGVLVRVDGKVLALPLAVCTADIAALAEAHRAGEPLRPVSVDQRYDGGAPVAPRLVPERRIPIHARP